MVQALSPLSVNNKHIPDNIAIHHWEEWKKSGVDDVIIRLNVESIYDSHKLDKILNRNNKRRWKHSDELVPAWCASGIDPLTGEATLQGVQVKPDIPRIGENGKPKKYEGAKDYDTAPLFLNTGIEGYWQQIIEDKSIPVVLTEGAKKAGRGLSINLYYNPETGSYELQGEGLSTPLPTISIPGVSTCRKKGHLHPSLELVAGFGRTFYFAFDNDLLTKKPVQNGLLGMARELAATGSKVMVIQIPDGDAKGMDDYIVAHGEEAFQDLIAQAKTIEEWKEEIKESWQQHLDDLKSSKRSKLARYMEIVRLGWGHDLKYNDLKSLVELAETPLDLNQVRLRIALEFDLDIPLQDAIAIVETIAQENRFHPVEDYLDSLSQKYPSPDLSILDNLATRYFGTDDPLHNTYLKKTLIAAVARIKKPGCKHDTSTILVGKQGAGKSTFWRHLFGDDWFTDELGDSNEKDELMKLHRFWCLEWSEFETVYKRKDVAALKKFMSSTTDAFRTPYSRSVREYPRRCILVGTTNETEILADSTGSRRFWIIPTSGYIPVEQLAEERDRIWAAAYALYQSGERWWLNAEDSAMQEEKNKDFQTQDPWTELVETYIQGKNQVSIAEIFSHLSVEPARQDVGLRKRIAAILKQLGFEHIRKYISGKWSWVWNLIKTKVENFNGSNGSNGSSSKNSSNYDANQEITYLDPYDPLDPLENPTFIFSEKTTESEKGDRTFEVGDTIRITSHPTRTDAVGLVEKIVRKVERGDTLQFKTESGILLCLGEFEKVEEANGSTLPVATDVEVGRVYWCERLKKQVRVEKVIKKGTKAEVLIPTEIKGEFDKSTVSLDELSEIPGATKTPKVEFKPGQSVFVLSGQHQGQTLLVSSVEPEGIWLRSLRKYALPLSNNGKPYQPQQLKKI